MDRRRTGKEDAPDPSLMRLDLQRRHDLLNAVFEGTSDAIFVKDLEGRYLLINSAGARFMGQSVQDVLGKDDSAFWDSESAIRLKHWDAEILASGKFRTSEEPISIDGVMRTYSATKGPLYDTEGRIVGLIGVSRDISHLKAVEDELRQRTFQLTERVKELHCVAEVSRVLYTAGDAVEEVLQQALAFIPPAWCYPDMASVCLRVGENTYCTPRYRPTGARLSVPLHGLGELEVAYPEWAGAAESAFLKEEQELLSTLARMFADALQRAEASRRNRRFQSIIENSSDLTTILDRAGCVAYESPSAERMLGYAPHELLGLDFLAMVHAEERDAVQAQLQDCKARPGAVVELDFRCVARGGSWRVLRGLAKNQLHDPAVDGVVLNLRDVTEAREAAEALQRSEQRLRDLQRMEAVGRLAGGIAHDYNNVLTAIGGTVEYVLLDMDPESEMAADMHDILTAVRRATDLTGQLLAFSRRQVVQPRPLSLSQSVAEMERILRRLIREDIRLETELDLHLAPVVSDPGQLHQLILNLAVNARDALPNGGTIALTTRSAYLEEPLESGRWWVPPGRYAVLSVADDGVGIPEDVLPFVFEPFFTTKEAGAGTGLGLATVYGIVQQTQGHVLIRSKVGLGTTVEVYLPMGEGSVQPEAAPARVATSGEAQERILVVEDDQAVRKLVVRILKREGYSVLEASCGSEALALADSFSAIDLVLTDVVMPGVSGRNLAEELRARRPTVPIVFMSGYTEDEVVKRGVRNGEVDFIQKPFAPNVLCEKIRQVLDG
jgi:two-component system, cell cycle sensor histidine kinase and response regulator CckA